MRHYTSCSVRCLCASIGSYSNFLHIESCVSLTAYRRKLDDLKSSLYISVVGVGITQCVFLHRINNDTTSFASHEVDCIDCLKLC